MNNLGREVGELAEGHGRPCCEGNLKEAGVGHARWLRIPCQRLWAGDLGCVAGTGLVPLSQ